DAISHFGARDPSLARRTRPRPSEARTRTACRCVRQGSPPPRPLHGRPPHLPFIGGGAGPEVHPVPRGLQFRGFGAWINTHGLHAKSMGRPEARRSCAVTAFLAGWS